jgi:hypothetical protein
MAIEPPPANGMVPPVAASIVTAADRGQIATPFIPEREASENTRVVFTNRGAEKLTASRGDGAAVNANSPRASVVATDPAACIGGGNRSAALHSYARYRVAGGIDDPPAERNTAATTGLAASTRGHQKKNENETAELHRDYLLLHG